MNSTPESQTPFNSCSALNCILNSESVIIRDGVYDFLNSDNEFYEGAYLNRIKYIPKGRSWPFQFPFYLVSNGFVWQVCRQFRPGARILELGCASGVDYLAQRYEMIGLDFSMQSLRGLKGYKLKVRADAADLPFVDNSVDGIISSYCWEHIAPETKDKILQSLGRCLKPNGKLVFLYDVETSNGLITKAEQADPELYRESFLERDGHIGYETVRDNSRRFEEHGFSVVRNIGMERTWIQSNSVFDKLKSFPGISGLVGKVGSSLSGGRFGYWFNVATVRTIDATVGKLWPIKNSRILMTVAQKKPASTS